MNKNKLIALGMMLLVSVFFLPLAYFDIDSSHPLKQLIAFIMLLFGILFAIYIGTMPQKTN